METTPVKENINEVEKVSEVSKPVEEMDNLAAEAGVGAEAATTNRTKTGSGEETAAVITTPAATVEEPQITPSIPELNERENVGTGVTVATVAVAATTGSAVAVTAGAGAVMDNDADAASVTATTTAAVVQNEVPTIFLSDGEDGPGTEAQQHTAKVGKKRSSVSGVGSVGSVGSAGGATSAAMDDEQRFRLKRRKIKVAGAPKMPLTGYVRYMNDRRESLRKEHPSKTAIEHTKIIGEEWNSLPYDRKAPYMKAAELDKQRYLAELHTFLKARPDVLACELAKNKARKGGGNDTACGQGGGSAIATGKSVLKEKLQSNGNVRSGKDINSKAGGHAERDSSPPPSSHPTAQKPFSAPVPGEIPIFTNEFLEHNKIFDMELRMLRKSKADLEQQNAVLEKHVENMKFGVEKMTNENDDLEEKNRLLETYLEKLKCKLAQALAGLAIPSEPNGATLENIDKYMQDLYNMATSNTHGPASLNKAKDIIRKLDLQIQL